MTPEWCSLYGTELWDRMTDEQRITLTKHEAASVAGTGIWFEMILMQMLLRDIYSHDPATRTSSSRSTRSPTSAGTPRCFARSAQRFGIPSYRPKRWIRNTARCSSRPRRARSRTAERCSREEILDMMQRDFMRDARVQPLTRTVSKIHVLEEARHIKFAREETVRLSGHCPAPSLRTSGWCSRHGVLHRHVPRERAGVRRRRARRRRGQAGGAKQRPLPRDDLVRLPQDRRIPRRRRLIGGPSKALLRRAHVI
ncbi:diiron oxygenase [Rhodococcus hoagii]|nr:diiron oxygenase [Prescottella equi]